MPNPLGLPLRLRVQPDTAVESLKTQRWPAPANARRSAAVRPVHKLRVEIITSRDGCRQRGHVEIRKHAAVERLEMQIGVEVRLEVRVDAAIERFERAVMLWISAEGHLHSAVESLYRAGSANILHIDAAVESVNIE